MRRMLWLALSVALVGTGVQAPASADDETPVDVQCYGDPPRQSEDPMSPPCAPYYDGDNGGDTYPGVTADEITVLVYADEGCPGHECPHERSGEYLDLNAPPRPDCPKSWPVSTSVSPCDFTTARIARAFVRSLNDTFQTYGRTVHAYLYLSDARTDAARKADAARNYDDLTPFAVLDLAVYNGFNASYKEAMAARGAVVFDGPQSAGNTQPRNHAGHWWSFWPDIEHLAELYTTYVCEKVVPYPVKRFGFGAGAPNGEPRRFGLYFTDDPERPELRLLAERIEAGIDDCGADVVAKGTFPWAGWTVNRSEITNMDAHITAARFNEGDVTTVLWLGGMNSSFTRAAGLQGYRPEIVFVGDQELDGNLPSRLQDQTVWRNAWGVQTQLRMGAPEDTPAFRAYKQAHPKASTQDAGYAQSAYPSFFFLFTGIQVAGPELTPGNLDAGFHAMPERISTNPYVASCFFDPGDYSCVKDATEVWWDPIGDSPASDEPGCMRMVRDGLRFLAGAWAGGDDAFENPDDPCTGFEGTVKINP